MDANPTEVQRDDLLLPVQPKKEEKSSAIKKANFGSKRKDAKGGADSDYNPYFSPPDLKIAEVHGRATMAGNSLSVYELNDEQFQENHPDLYETIKSLPKTACPCCGKDENGSMVSLFTSSMELGRLGTAIPGFFDYSYYLIYAMLLSTLIYSIYSMLEY